MMFVNKRQIAMLCLVFALGCKQQEQATNKQPTEIKWPNAVAYEIFVHSFADGNGDRIGDIKGMSEKLPYLQDLGIKAIWLMPMSPSPSYHKYDVTDYYDIHPDYGTLEEFKSFVQAAHQHDIKVIIDLVINHTARDHPWFQEAMKGKDNPYRDWYVWAKKEDVENELDKKEVHFDSDNINQWHEAEGNDELYYGYFWGGMPDLNFDNPEVKKEIFKIGRYWLEEIDVDGFRLDAARHIFPDERAADNHAFWREFKAEMQKVKADVYTIGEIWANMETTAPYAPGFTSFFNFDLAFSILESVNSGKNVATSISHTSYEQRENSNLADALKISRDTFSLLNPAFHDAIFLSNHDQNRVMSVFEGDISKAKLAASILLSLPGTPYLYYGEEIGMLGKKPDPQIREPFLWDKAANDRYRTRAIQGIHTNESTVYPLNIQQEDSSSLYHHYKKLISIRNKSEILSLGEIVPINQKDKRILLYKRVYQGKEALVIHNLSEQKISMEAGDLTKNYQSKLFANNASIEQDKIILNSRSSLILSL